MIYPDFIDEWLASFTSLEDALVEADITEGEALYYLWLEGHIEPPTWIAERLEDELQSRDEED